MRKVYAALLIVSATLLASGPAFAQGGTSGALQGTVVSSDGQPLGGVTVRLTSAALQGEVVKVTDANGAFNAKPLPPGDYTVELTMEGLQSRTYNSKINVGQVSNLDATMDLVAASEEVIVVGEAVNTISETSSVAVTLDNELMEALPTNRTQIAAVQLAPGAVQVAGNRFSLSGAMTFENSYQINGVDVVDNVRRTPYSLFVEDAIEETTVQTAGISAEFGRFTGGTINSVTKSGGNNFHGSFRDSLTNEDWNGENDFSPEPIDKVNGVYEATLGGFVLPDRIWFFASGRDFDREFQAVTNQLNIPFDRTQEETRLEGKLTASITPNHRVVGSYMDIDFFETSIAHGGLTQYLVTTDALDDRELPQTLMSVNYSGVMTANFLLEAQYSEREFTFGAHGGRSTDPVEGTVMFDAASGFMYNASLFCGVCTDAGDYRNNDEMLAKASYFLSTDSLGSHDLVAGYDLFSDKRGANNYQSASGFLAYTFEESLYENNAATVINTSGYAFLAYYPVLQLAQETDFETESLFINDRWRLNESWSFNLGVRYDTSQGTNESGAEVLDDSQFSPRLAASFNPGGNSPWTFNAGYARYVGAIANTVGDASAAGGQPSYLGWIVPLDRVYDGTISNHEYLTDLFANFEAMGGIDNRSDLVGANISGYSRAIGDGLDSPSADEITFGFVRQLGSKGLWRVDLVHRDYHDFYITAIDTSTGQSTDPILGLETDFGIVETEDDFFERTYDAIQTQANYRITDRWTVGGNYTYSELEGNIEGETGGSGPTTSSFFSYPEYKEGRWNAPNGRLLADTPHKAGAYVVWDAIENERHTLTLSVLQNFTSGTPYGTSTTGFNPSRYVTNPGYLTPPTQVQYFYEARDKYTTDDLTRTDFGAGYAIRFGGVEVFAQADVTNIFDEDGVVLPNTSVTRLATFNPFTETPVEGVNWRKGGSFGQPTAVGNLQAVRTVTMSLGLRF